MINTVFKLKNINKNPDLDYLKNIVSKISTPITYGGNITNIDEVSIWNIALDASQINNYMNCPLNGNELGLVGYWDFNEGDEEKLIGMIKKLKRFEQRVVVTH